MNYVGRIMAPRNICPSSLLCRMSLKVLMGRDGVVYLVSSSNIADGHPQGAIPALPIKLG